MNAPVPPKSGAAAADPAAETPADPARDPDAAARREGSAGETETEKTGPGPSGAAPGDEAADGGPMVVFRGRHAPARTPPAAPPAKPPPPAAPARPSPAAADPPVPPTARRSRLHGRHAAVLVSFLLMVMLPALVAAWYLWTRAADQYASFVGFSVRTEEQGAAISSLLGAIDLSSAATPDAEILYEFIQSQDLVARIDQEFDLRMIWSRADPSLDPVFAYHPPGTIEDLLDHWRRMVKIAHDTSTGLIELRVLAFTPEDARAVAEAIFAESTEMINALSALAREDAIGYAREELEAAEARLRTARRALTEFRNRTQIVDPTIDVQGQAGLLNTLNQQLAGALIELDLLRQTTRENDPRIAQAERKIQVIEARIAEEKRKLGITDGGEASEAFATLTGEYESLVVDREFAEQSYTAALAAFDAAQAEARRQSRYLAAHVRPTLAEKSEYPQRWTLLGLLTLFAFLIWSVLVLVAYSLRDRR